MQHLESTFHYIASKKKRIICKLLEEQIVFQIRKNGSDDEHRFRYTDIQKIHLGLSDVSWHTIDIYFTNKLHLHLQSVTHYIEREDQKFTRSKINEADITKAKANQKAYYDFVIGLHERIILQNAAEAIKFTHGNPWKKALIWIFLVVLIIWTHAMLKSGYYMLSLFFGAGFLLLFLFSMKIDFRKKYQPNLIPSKYLP
ncbi:hypothetical protein [Sphingobacterium deserti]|uniref:Uncharacterized protein n=1 Tax=Sphingobacterium deserti TaxID=1229276 RepID=A0A0B8T678_9SPHI|nr:hypothetical protein [Sphingobacterium deserti]KGE13414.1 hypothetical protein DI53_2945 [Sphingobacterium deserti]